MADVVFAEKFGDFDGWNEGGGVWRWDKYLRG